LTGPVERSSNGVRRVSGSGDAKLIGILVAATLALGVAGILAIPFITAQDRSGDVIESYTATLRRDGTLEETYVYTLKSSDTRMLFRYWEENLMDESKCTSCGVCVDRCHFGARDIKDGKLEYNKDLCFGCGLCVSTCPTKAISLIPLL
jgi:ferredoxin